MGLEIEFEDSGGRKHNSMADMLGAEVSEVVADYVTTVEEAMRSQRCDIHGEYPTVSASRGAGEINFSITGCCERLVEKAQAAGDAAL